MELYDEQIEKEISEDRTPVLVEFLANWCRPCKVMEPIIEELEQEFLGKVKFIKINIEENQDLASKFPVYNLPTILVYNDGRQVRKFTGVQHKKNLDHHS